MLFTLRLILLCFLGLLSTQAWSYSSTTSPFYFYDASEYLSLDQSAESTIQETSYAGEPSFPKFADELQAESTDIKIRAEVFIASVDGLFVTKEGTTVIGRVKDLQKLNKGEKSLLDRLPDQGSPKANWKQNSGVLRQEMGKGKPIRDASPGDTTGQFLNAERNLLESRGWTFDKSTNFWKPPK